VIVAWPVTPPLVAKIVAVPVDTPVIAPVVGLTAATPLLLDVQDNVAPTRMWFAASRATALALTVAPIWTNDGRVTVTDATGASVTVTVA
jgi:hypothetical protein